jgi:hypothetical protein
MAVNSQQWRTFMDSKRWWTRFLHVLFLTLLAMTLVACSSVNGGGSGAEGAANTTSPTLYRDFDDILLPSEMEIDPKRTYIVEGSGLTTGILTVKGWVDRDSLITFFKSAMNREKWQEIASFKSPSADTSSILVFQKVNRTAVISIHEELIYTYVEIAVAPSAKGIGGGLMQDAGAQ